MGRCQRGNLSASVSKPQEFHTSAFRGLAWRLTFELSKRSAITYRTAVIQRGRTVAKVTFTPAASFDISQRTFYSLAQRAAERLRYAGQG